jgi:ribonucleoside-diphosphate reductase alpha chain
VIGQGLVDSLLEDATDDETNKELGCWATINTAQKPAVPNSPEILFCLKSQGINGDIIREFINYVESNKLKLLKTYDDIKDDLPKTLEKVAAEQACAQMQFLIDEVSNLKLKKTQNSITVEQVVKRIDKDRFSAISYGLYYINLFLDRQEVEEYDDDDPIVYY